MLMIIGLSLKWTILKKLLSFPIKNNNVYGVQAEYRTSLKKLSDKRKLRNFTAWKVDILRDILTDLKHCVKNVRIWIFFWSVFSPHSDWIRRDTEYTEYLSVFSPNAGKYGPEKLRIRTLFTQCFKSVRMSLI